MIVIILVILFTLLCTWIVLSALWASEDRKHDHEEWEDDTDGEDI